MSAQKRPIVKLFLFCFTARTEINVTASFHIPSNSPSPNDAVMPATGPVNNPQNRT